MSSSFALFGKGTATKIYFAAPLNHKNTPAQISAEQKHDQSPNELFNACRGTLNLYPNAQNYWPENLWAH